ncbi:MAG: histidine phosphatase family protein, partial [Candidatus Microsaccharimonas sp.]
GRHRDDVYTPAVLDEIERRQLDFSQPNGESNNQVADRVLGWAFRTARQHPDSVILAASHGQAIRSALGRLLGWSRFETTIDPAHFTRNVSLSHLSIHDDQIEVKFWGKDIIEPVEMVESKLY